MFHPVNLEQSDFIICPFDPNHRVRYSRFYNHFVKCQKNHPKDTREHCPYNASEMIEPDDMKDHLQVCKYKSLYANRTLDGDKVPVYDAPTNFKFDSDVQTEEKDNDPSSSVLKSKMNDDESETSSFCAYNYNITRSVGRGRRFLNPDNYEL